MAGTDSISIYRGEDAVLTFTMDPVEDVSGWAVSFTVRSSDGVQVSKTVGSGVTLSDPTNGVFTVSLADTDTDALAPGVYEYDVWRTDAGSERVLAIGSFVVADVVRDVS